LTNPIGSVGNLLQSRHRVTRGAPAHLTRTMTHNAHSLEPSSDSVRARAPGDDPITACGDPRARSRLPLAAVMTSCSQ
jgi:hypothetical protein